MDNELRILIRAVLDKASKEEILAELNKLTKITKPIKLPVEVNTDKSVKSIKEINSFYKNIETTLKNTYAIKAKLISATEGAEKHALESNLKLEEMRLQKMNARKFDSGLYNKEKEIQQTKLLGDLQGKLHVTEGKFLDKEADQVIKAVDAEKKKSIELKKQTAEMQRQIDIYKDELRLKLINDKTSYGSSMGSTSSIVAKKNLLDTADLSNYKNRIADVNLEVKKQESLWRANRAQVALNMKEADNFATTLVKDFQKMAIWSLAGTAIFGSLRALKDGISYVTELDNSLNSIMIVTNKSQVEVDNLAKSYNRLAREMKVSTTDVVSQVNDLYRQGLSGNDVDERMKAIIKYAKISGIEVGASNEILTASIAGSKAGVEDLINTFSYLGDATSSGAEEIGKAFQKTASIANVAGMQYKKLASYVAVVSSTTRESAETVGNSLKSLISRYQSIRSKGFNSEDATTLNMVVKALHDVGIKATTESGQLREYSSVLDELAGKWGSLDKNQRSYVQTALAGKMNAPLYRNIY